VPLSASAALRSVTPFRMAMKPSFWGLSFAIAIFAPFAVSSGE
jgi:hypothetical protein